MFYSHTILGPKSPLGTVWIAAHLERKIKKPQIDGIDIPSSGETIMFPEVPIALRLSGHLLLGLVRIYSWKVNYLFQDCNQMVATVRTAFVSVEVDLPVDVDRSLFDSITLPPTFNLDDLNLDEVISQINTPDNHQKTLDEITLADGGEYVMIDLDEDDRVEPPALSDGTFSWFDDDFGANNSLSNEISLDPLLGNSPENTSIKNPSNEAKDLPEIMREAPQEGHDYFTDSTFENDDPMVVDQDSSPFVPNNVITSPATDETSSAGQQIPLQTPNTNDLIDDLGSLNSDNKLPELGLEPSPPLPQAQDNKRKREIIYDFTIVLSDAYMREQLKTDSVVPEELVCKRRKLPLTDLDMWKVNWTTRKDGSFLLEPLVQGMCTSLHVTYERNFLRVSDLDAEFAYSKPMATEENGSCQDAAPERQLTPRPHGNEDALPEGDSKSPGSKDPQPEPRTTPELPGGAGTAPDEDMLPEFPLFSPVGMPSPI